MELATARLRLRPWRAADRAPFAALNADAEVMAHYPAPLDRAASDALAARVEAHWARRGFGLWAVEAPGVAEFVGYVGLAAPGAALPFASAEDPPVEVGWRLARAHWGRGYTTEAARAALADGFGRLGLAEVVSFTAAGNARSRGDGAAGDAPRAGEDFDHPALFLEHLGLSLSGPQSGGTSGRLADESTSQLLQLCAFAVAPSPSRVRSPSRSGVKPPSRTRHRAHETPSGEAPENSRRQRRPS